MRRSGKRRRIQWLGHWLWALDQVKSLLSCAAGQVHGPASPVVKWEKQPFLDSWSCWEAQGLPSVESAHGSIGCFSLGPGLLSFPAVQLWLRMLLSGLSFELWRWWQIAVPHWMENVLPRGSLQDKESSHYKENFPTTLEIVSKLLFSWVWLTSMLGELSKSPTSRAEISWFWWRSRFEEKKEIESSFLYCSVGSSAVICSSVLD